MTPLAAQAPEGWRVRVDRSANASDPDDVPDLKVATMGKGFRATGGPAGTFWNPANRVTGNYTARATFNLMKPSGHVNYYGLVFGGSDLDGAAQKYVYFMVAQNGTFIIRSRAGEQVQDVRERVQHAAVRQPGADGRSTNTLEVRVAGNTISYVDQRHRRAHHAEERRHRDHRRPRRRAHQSRARCAGGELRGRQAVVADLGVTVLFLSMNFCSAAESALRNSTPAR